MPLTHLYMVLFSFAQPYRDAREVSCSMALELCESKLDESLSYLDEGNARRAREEVKIVKEFGSMETYREFLGRNLRFDVVELPRAEESGHQATGGYREAKE